jgi:hypothetical protein
MIRNTSKSIFTDSSLARASANTFMHTFSEANATNPLNATIAKLGTSESDLLMVRSALREFGQERFVNLSRSYPLSASVLSMYAGNGIVAKVIEESVLSRTNNVIYHLPAIKQKRLEGKDGCYQIKLYPWISPEGVDQEAVDRFAKHIAQYGMMMNKGDALPKNVHRLPDQKGSFVGIDSDMYHELPQGLTIPDGLVSAWHKYLHILYPIYLTQNVPNQTDSANFSFISLHNPSTGLVSFEDFVNSNADIKPFSEETFRL